MTLSTHGMTSAGVGGTPAPIANLRSFARSPFLLLLLLTLWASRLELAAEFWAELADSSGSWHSREIDEVVVRATAIQ